VLALSFRSAAARAALSKLFQMTSSVTVIIILFYFVSAQCISSIGHIIKSGC